MLTNLTIDNYALIDNSIIEFSEGFTVITGETGAGKSIMLGALSFLMGQRADTKVVGNKERKMVVEAIFSKPDIKIENICIENGIDWDSRELILRREISKTGKSRGFVNDTPVNLSVLTTIAESLLDIHTQHSNSLLNKSIEQLAILDSFGRNEKLLEDYKETFQDYVSLRNKLKKLKESISQGKANQEFLSFRLEQLDKIKPKRGELEILEREAEILGDADRIKTSLSEAQRCIGGSANSTIKSLQSAISILDGLNFDLLDPQDDDNLLERLNSLKIELRDISDTLEGYSEKIESNPARYEKVQSRIENLYDTMKRFKVKDENELVNLYEKIKEELDNLTGNKPDISEMELELKDKAKILKEKADILTSARTKVAEKFSEFIENKIIPLGLPNVKFKVDIEKGKMSSEGQDIITFLCSFNKNHPMQPISEIASGGEISRVMLGIKSIMAENMNLPTIIFDEIDTGVSGEVAHKMGELMHEMSKSIQVMAVTHLPQVAANGDSHLKVYKEDTNEKTFSHIKKLKKEERIQEIAGMLSGTSINEVALENAKMLMNFN